MKLKELKLNNIGVHKDLTVEFGDFTTISGGNAEGKTTIDNAIIEAIEGCDVPLLSNSEESGSIEVFYDNDLSVKIPFRKDGKCSPEIKQGNMKFAKPRTQLKEWHNDARIRAIDFFSGKGAELKKYQTDTIMSILDIKLDKKEVTKITNGELPLEDFFYGEHPLNYIKRLVNEKDGYYYKKRAENNEGVQTITHSNNTLFKKITEKLDQVGIDPLFFDPNDYRNISVTDEISKMKDLMQENQIIEASKAIVNGYEDAKRAILSRKEEAIKDEGELFKFNHGRKLETLSKEVERLKKELADAENELAEEEKTYHSKFEGKLESIRIRFDGELEALEKNLETAKLNSEKELNDVDSLKSEIDKVQTVKEVLPTYDSWTNGAQEYENMKEYSEELTEIIKKLRKLPSDILKREKLPIEGLSMNEDGEFVIVNSHGTPVLLNQLSGFERLKLSLDVSIARLGEIRALIIPQWSEIDVENKNMIKAYLKERDVQGIAIEVSSGSIKVEKE